MQPSGVSQHEEKQRKPSREERESGRGIPGYTYGSKQVATSPLSLEDLELLKQTVLWTDEDTKYMRMSKEVLEDQTDQILDVWYSFVKVTPHLAMYFGHNKDHKPNEEYMESVRLRFKQWILDTADANYDQDWLNYQHEIGLRHHRTKKNQTDEADSVPIIHFRYIPALVYPVTATLKPFLAKKHDHDAEDVECMYHAWLKSVIMQVCLWSYPYVKDGDY
ncbi:protoglobin domain-containing protein [Bdellovibrio sp. HCB337]|uniref:protoglobin domain-containing protein n=1 Tax=Bdellovibrio sp. HCB337 TaxID=3394358 RepID=UPI0039A52D94